MQRISFLITLCAVFSLTAAAQSEPSKVALVAFAPIGPDVPQRAPTKAAALFVSEIKNTEGLSLVEVKRTPPSDTLQNSLKAARKSVEEAKALRKKRKFRLAEESLTQALAAYKSSAAAISDIGEVVDAYALLSGVQFNTGRDEEGQRSLNTAVALAPYRPLPLAATSPLFSKVVEDTRKNLAAGAKGSLVVESNPPGSQVWIDGVSLGATPLSVTAMPPTTHFWKTVLPSGEEMGGVVEVASGKQAKVSAQSSSKDPEARLLLALAHNKVDGDLLASAKTLAGSLGVDLLLFGALSKDGKGLGLDAMVFAASTSEVRRLPHVSFDTELLSAGVEFYGLSGQLAQKGAKVGEAVKPPSPLLAGQSSIGKLTEVKFGQGGQEPNYETEPEAAVEAPADSSNTRVPLAPKKRAPLKK